MKIRKFYLTTFFFILLILVSSAGTHQVQAQTTPLCGETPSDVVIMLDRTASVSPENRQKEAEAAKKLVDLLLINKNNRVALGRFGAGTCQTSLDNWRTQMDWVDAEVIEKLSNDPTALENTIDQNMNEESCGGTDLHDAIAVAQNELNFGNNPNRILILISDGDPNQPLDTAQARALALGSAQEAKDSGTRIFTIAFDASGEEDEANRQRLAALASNDSQDNSAGAIELAEQETENTDGDDFFIAPSGDDLEQVFKNIGEVILCDDGNACTTDTCQPTGHCAYVDNGSCVSEDPCPEGGCAPNIFIVDPPANPEPDPSLEPSSQDSPPEAAPLFLFGGGLGCSLFFQSPARSPVWKYLVLTLLLPLPALRFLNRKSA